MADVSIINEDARFTDGHIRLGVAGGDHAVAIWPLLCGMAKAKYYLLTADFLDGREAERIGLVSKAVPAGEVMSTALGVAVKLAAGPVDATRMTKRALNHWLRQALPNFEASLAYEMLNFLGPDAAEGLAGAAGEARSPAFGHERLIPVVSTATNRRAGICGSHFAVRRSKCLPQTGSGTGWAGVGGSGAERSGRVGGSSGTVGGVSNDDAANRPDVAPETTAITAGRCSGGTSLAPALWASSTWESESLDDAHRRATSVRHGNFYSRYANPTVRSFERAVAELEGAEDSLAFASGMGALASTVFALCSSGSHIVTQRQLYAGSLAFLQGPCQRFGIDVTYVDVAEPGAFAAAVVPGRTMLVLAETPSNPRLELADLDELGSIKGPFTVVDSTFATPLGQRPLDHGVDISLHSATKGIAGHNDATLGVISGEADLLGEIWAYSVLHGATPSPFDALNALRGIRTLGVRTRQQNETARSLAVTLADHPAVVAVHYPGLSEHPQHDLATKQLRQYGTVLSFEVADRDAAARAFLDSLQIARVADVARRAGDDRVPSRHVDARQPHPRRAGERPASPPGLLRVSVGLEDGGDIVADFERALSTSA